MHFRTTIAAALPLVLSACAQTLPVDVVGDNSPANIDRGIHHVRPGATIGDYTHREPVDPGPWRRLNDERAPKRGDES